MTLGQAIPDAAPTVTMQAGGLEGLMPVGLDVREGVSRPFRIDVEFLASDPKLDIKSLLGQPVTVTFEADSNGAVREFDGIASRVELVGYDLNATFYRMRLRPKFWFLRKSANCRIFQGKSAQDIISQIFSEQGLSDFEWKISGSAGTLPREYCVQFGESDANFVSRLLVEEGISYYFTHADGLHTLILCDDLTSSDAVAGSEDIRLAAHDSNGQTGQFQHWSSRLSMQTGTVTTREYDFRKPRAVLEGTSQVNVSAFQGLGAEAYELYRYPSGVARQPDSEFALDDITASAQIRLESVQAGVKTIRAVGNAYWLKPGDMVNISTDFTDESQQSYVVLDAVHRIGYEKHGRSQGGDGWYDGRYLLQHAANPIRRRPRCRSVKMPGPQTAVVIGPTVGDPNTDQFGRLQVCFPWDREGANTCWLRCVQSFAGKGWGSFILPRVGQEVVVEFFNGDPDRPIVTGALYNADMTGPLTLPDQMALTSMKTKTLGAESPDQGHELTFDDTSGTESILLHSERDFVREVENNDSLKVGFDKQDPGDQTIGIFNNQVVTIGDDSAADGSQTVMIKSNRSVTLKEGDDTLSISQGDWNVSLSSGTATISAAQQIVLKVGSTQLSLDASGITLQGTTIEIDADGSLVAKAAEIKEQASAEMTLQGGVVKIN
ncbi:MAG: type VI secretion system tip protein VgrG [Planctomycetaceae bacterium]|nr:type VI secretion system tip protein VgrG [Planctomycetaceae bacterium]